MARPESRLGAIGATLVLLAACGSERPAADSVATTVAGDTMAIARAFAEPPRDSNLACAPSVVGTSDTLRMTMSVPHGATFHVAAPDGTPFIVVFHGEGARDRGQRRSLVPPDSFATLTRVDLPVGSLRAGVWVFGRDTNERVFVAPGFYRLRVGSDMETDGPRYAECVVRLRP
jgi:hypothetical protein